jgi:hypothetical protein
MSADAWRICPKCRIKHIKSLVRERQRVNDKYGKIDSGEYIQLVNEMEKKETTDIEETLREDYEIWTNEEGVFEVGYYCSCEKCGLKFEFEHKEKITN